MDLLTQEKNENLKLYRKAVKPAFCIPFLNENSIKMLVNSFRENSQEIAFSKIEIFMNNLSQSQVHVEVYIYSSLF